jgi:hypothetical protein
LQQRVEQLTRAITEATPLIEQIGNSIDNLIRAADEEGITPEQIAAITADIAAIGEQTRILSLMLPPADQIPPPAAQAQAQAPVDDGEGRAGGGKKAKKTKKSKRKTRKMRKTKGRKQRGGYNWVTSSRSRSASSSSRTRSSKRRTKKSRSSL